MKQKIQACIDSINKSIEWTRENRPAEYEKIFVELVEQRSQLKKVLVALEDNPGIAAYGVSQTGKSHIISDLLQRDGESFLVEYKGQWYDFIVQMNPITNGTEATGVVTRFTSYMSHGKERYSNEWPIMMRVLTVRDLLLILCEGFYNNVIVVSDKEEEIKEYGKNLVQKYIAMPILSSPLMTADDLIEMKHYFRAHIRNASAYINTDFFNNLATVVERIPSADYCEVFAKLWQRQSDMTALFTRLMALQQRFEFQRDVYIPIESLLQEGDNRNTILSVECLNDVATEDKSRTTFALLRDGPQFKRVDNIRKSELSAVCAEVVLKVDAKYIEGTKAYCMDDEVIAPSLRRFEGADGVDKRLLESNDLLDFPGAKTPDKNKTENLNKPELLSGILLRGKVSYLFNKYSDARLINILLYCHDNEDHGGVSMWETIEAWVKTYIGETTEKREAKLRGLDGISPLFFISTKFNTDMAFNPNKETANTRTAVDSRWEQRFHKLAYKMCFSGPNAEWVDNWTAPNTPFRNSYLLRDFKFSSDKPGNSGLYHGFMEGGKENTRLLSDDFYNMLRQSFVESNVVKHFFENPELSWDVAATRNNDGALYVIDRLSKVAKLIDESRNRDFADLVGRTGQHVWGTMYTYYNPTDYDSLLKKSIREAKAVIRELDIACNSDIRYFGHMLRELQVREPDINDEIHNMINSGELNSDANDNKEYEVLRERLGKALSVCSTDEDRWEVVLDEYGFVDKQEAESYFAKKGVDMAKLFAGNFRQRVNSVIIADKIFGIWRRRVEGAEVQRRLTENSGVDPNVIISLTKNMVTKSLVFHLPDIMAENIAEFTNILGHGQINVNLVADLLSGIISDYVMDLGYSLLNADQVDNLKRIMEQYRLPVFEYAGKVRRSNFEPDELAAQFDKDLNSPDKLPLSFRESFKTWTEHMMASFVSNIDVPREGIEANNRLKAILDTLKSNM